MRSSGDAPIRRVATLRFAPAPRLHIPTGISYTDINSETGARIRVPVRSRAEQSAEHAVYLALLRLALIQVATLLKVDWRNPPSWVPHVDEVLDAGVKLAASDLHTRLLEDSDDEDVRVLEMRTSVRQPGRNRYSNASVHSIPQLFSRIGIAFEAVERQSDGIARAFIDPRAGARERFVSGIAHRAVKPFNALLRIFGLGNHQEPAELRLGVALLAPDENVPKLGEIEDLAIATCIAWTANVETSVDERPNQRLGFWLCDGQNNPISKKVALDLKRDAGTTTFSLDLSPEIGGSELSMMNDALGKLVQFSPDISQTESGAIREASAAALSQQQFDVT